MSKKEYYLLTFNEDYADEHNVPALACMSDREFLEWKTGNVELYAKLGNSGDEFEEDYKDCVTGNDFIDNGYVEITPVYKSFYDTFHKANLSSLSLCSVFGE